MKRRAGTIYFGNTDINSHNTHFKNMIIAVDFDGTIVEHRYPEIGKERPFATLTLKQLIADGHRLILWTVREGKLLDEAVEWCRQRGVEFYAVNRDYEEETQDNNNHYSRKIKANLFIDDCNVGGLPDWGVIYEVVKRRSTFEDYYLGIEHKPSPRKKKKHWWNF